MAEPDPIPTLFMLSLTALIDHVKNKKLKISPDQIPINIHKYLWDNSTVLDLIINTCHPLTRDWFSTRVIRPPVITVNFRENAFADTCLIQISFEGRPTIPWTLASSHWPAFPGPKFIIRTGNQYVSTQMNYNNAGFFSRLTNYGRSCFEVINWICKVFRCEINELKMEYDAQMLNWPKLKTANSLKIYELEKLEVLEELIIARRENNLRTTLDEVNIETPIQKELLPFIDFNIAQLNFSNLKVHQLIEEFRELFQRAHGTVIARTMNLSTEDFERFKAQLKFDNRSTTSVLIREVIELKLRIRPEFRFSELFDNARSKKFCSFQDDKITSFKFMCAKPGIYNKIIMSIY